MYEVKDFPDFSWSLNRHKIFEYCQMAYYYNYYKSHKGWCYDADPEIKKTYALKQLTNYPMFLGSSVHNSIKKYLINFRSGHFSSDSFIEECIKKDFDFAKQSTTQPIEKWMTRPKEPMFFEVYYNNDHQNGFSSMQYYFKKRHNLSSGFFNSYILKLLKEKRDVNFIEIDEDLKSNLNWFMLDDIKIYSKPDLVFEDNNQIIIGEWKTGKESNVDMLQASLSALYIQEKYSFEVSNITTFINYLSTQETKTVSNHLENSEHYLLSDNNFKSLKYQIKNSVEKMKNFLINGDTKKNQPIKEKFTKTSNEEKCKLCKFKAICIERK